MLWLIAFIVLLGWFLVLRSKNRKIREVAKTMKSDLNTIPCIGHAHHFRGGGENRMSILQNFSRQAIKFGGWTAVWLGSTFYGVVSDAVDTDHVMRYHLEKDDIVKVATNLIGNGLIFAPVSIWRPRRKILAPTFSQHNLNEFVNVFYKQSCQLVENLKAKANREAFPIWTYITSYTMDSVCQTTLGTDIGIQQTQNHPFFQYFQTYADLTAKRFFYPWLHYEPIFRYIYLKMYATCSECLNYLRGFVTNIIEKKRIVLKEKTTNNTNNTNVNGFKPIMELLIEGSGGEKGYTNKELLEEALVVLLAGTDTSAVGAAFVAMMLAKYPHIQEQVYKEIHSFYGDSDRPIVADDLNQLNYLEMVVKETLRLYTPVPITARKIVKDDVLPSGQKLVAGMGVIISHWGNHRNPKYWGEDVEEFRPERFVDSPPTHPGAYIPFSSGPRNCLGYKYAMLSMMTVTTSLLRKYRILPANPDDVDKPFRLTYQGMMKHNEDFLLRLEPRR